MAGSITLDPTSIDFGSVAVGSLDSQTLNIIAMGFGPFSITAVTNSVSDFSSGITIGALNTGNNNFPVNFVPSSTGSQSDTFVITILDGSTESTTDYDLQVTGTGTAAPPAAVTGFVTVVSQ